MRILLADDDHDVRLALRVTLEDAGNGVLEADDGIRAIQLATSEKPDLIMLDVTMPQMDGLEALKILKSNPATENIPVIMVSGIADSLGIDAWRRLGASDFICKPWACSEVETVVARALRDVSVAV